MELEYIIFKKHKIMFIGKLNSHLIGEFVPTWLYMTIHLIPNGFSREGHLINTSETRLNGVRWAQRVIVLPGHRKMYDKEIHYQTI